MRQSTRTLAASRAAALVGGFDRSPAYAGLAEALTLAIGDGRVGLDTRLPSERDLTDALGVSRTTVTRAYARLRESGYAEARRGAGTFTRLPGERERVVDRALSPRPVGTDDVIDLGCAASSAPPGLAAAYADALTELPVHLGGHGYFPAGLPALQAAIAATYDARGLPTDPGQIMVTPGALTAMSVVAQALTTVGDRVVVESPVYPNATQAIGNAGARLVGSPLDAGGWDLDATAATLRQVAPRLTYLIPDFQNPTGHLMSDAQREEYAAALRRSGTLAVVDEAHQALALDARTMPRPFAAFAPDTVTLGSASKSHWGGLRLGWIRAPRTQVDRLLQARLGLDLGSPVLEQLVLARLLAGDGTVVEHHRARLHAQRAVLLDALRSRLPDWRFHRPGGGLALWCRLPSARATDLAAEAERRGLVVTPGPVFAVEGGLSQFVRLPWVRPVDDLVRAVEILAEAWEVVDGARRAGARASVPRRVTVA